MKTLFGTALADRATELEAPYTLDKAAAEASCDDAELDRLFEDHLIPVEDGVVHVRIGGEGTPLLLLHGWPGSWTSWRKAMPQLACHHRVIAVDLPGFGNSTALVNGEKTLAAARIRGAVHALGYDRVAIASHDMGAPVAFAYAAGDRQSVSHWIAMDTAIPGFGLATGKPDDIMIVTPQRNAFHIPLFMVPQIAEPLIRGKEDFFIPAMTQGALYNKAALSARDTQDIIEAVSGEKLLATLGYYAAWFADAKANHALARSKLDIPVLALSATDSFLSDQTAYSLGMVAHSVEKVVIGQTGHFIAEERPITLANYITAFLAT